MVRQAALLACAGALAAAAATFAAGAGAGPAADPDALLRRHVEEHGGGTGIVAVVIEPGPTAAVRRVFAYGASRGRPVDERTLFEIGSITKVFTALLLADMVRRREVALDAPVAELLPAAGEGPEPPAASASITLRELATHTSGLPRLPFGGAMVVRLFFRSHDPYAGTTEEELFRALARIEPSGRGETAYSNFGVAVLGHLLAARAGRPYGELLEERVLGPAGLADTRLGAAAAPRSRLARGHGGNGRPAAHWRLGAYAPAGGLVSSAADLAALLEQQMIDPDPLWRFRSEGGDAEPVRLGWLQGEIGGEELIWHNGGTGGFRSFIGLLPGEGRGAVVLSNGALSVDPLGRALLGDETLPGPPERRRFWELATALMMLLPPVSLGASRARLRRERREPGGADPARPGTLRNRWHFLSTLAAFAFLYAVFIPWGSWHALPYWTAHLSAGLAALLAAALLPEIRKLPWRGEAAPWRLALTVAATLAYAVLAALFLWP